MAKLDQDIQRMVAVEGLSFAQTLQMVRNIDRNRGHMYKRDLVKTVSETLPITGWTLGLMVGKE